MVSRALARREVRRQVKALCGDDLAVDVVVEGAVEFAPRLGEQATLGDVVGQVGVEPSLSLPGLGCRISGHQGVLQHVSDLDTLPLQRLEHAFGGYGP